MTWLKSSQGRTACSSGQVEQRRTTKRSPWSATIKDCSPPAAPRERAEKCGETSRWPANSQLPLPQMGPHNVRPQELMSILFIIKTLCLAYFLVILIEFQAPAARQTRTNTKLSFQTIKYKKRLYGLAPQKNNTTGCSTGTATA